MPPALTIRPAEAMSDLGAGIAPRLRRGDAVLLWGPMGAGKSTFARGLVRALIGPQTEVPSPTFSIVQYYETAALRLAHVDLYRLTGPHELAEIGLEEAMDEGAVIIEWPERLAALGGTAPWDRLDVVISPDDADMQARRVVITAHGAMAERWSGGRG